MSGQEAATRVRVVTRLAESIEAIERTHPTRVAIDGPDAAGKTTLAEEIAAALAERGRNVIRASIDGFHRPRAERYRQGALSPTGYFHDSFDYQQLRLVLLDPLGPGGDRRYRTHAFDHRLDRPDPAPWRSASPESVLLFDGVFLQRPELAAAWEFCIFVWCDVEETLRRAKNRDTALFASAVEIETRYRTRYIPGQQLYLETLTPVASADAVVDNNDPPNPILWHS